MKSGRMSHHILNAYAALESSGFYDGPPFDQDHGDARIDGLARLLVFCSPTEQKEAVAAASEIIADIWNAECEPTVIWRAIELAEAGFAQEIRAWLRARQVAA